MNSMQKFLNTLNDRIQEVSSVLNQLDYQKNVILELENIFLQHQISKGEISGEALMKLSFTDFNKIMELLEIYDFTAHFTKFTEYLKKIKLYEKVGEQLTQKIDILEYQEALSWFNTMGALITKNYEKSLINDPQRESDLKASIAIYKRYQEMFRGDELVVPIFNMWEFHNLLVDCHLTITDITAIKLLIGKTNIRLVMAKNVSAEDITLIQKYQLILEKKQKTYTDDILVVQELIKKLGISLNLSEVETQINMIAASKPTMPLKNIQNAVFCIFLMPQLENFCGEVATAQEVAKLINSFETMLKISRHYEPQKVSSEKKCDNKESKDLIKQANFIFDTEKSFLETINPNEYERYTQLLLMLNGKKRQDNIEEEKYRLALVIETLRQELKAFSITAAKYSENPTTHFNNYRQQTNTIKDYIAVYKLLKQRIDSPSSLNKIGYKILYLTNPDGKAVITQYIFSLAESYRVSIKNIINDLSKGKLANKETAVIIENHTIFTIERRNVVVSYILLSNNVILIIFAAQKKINTDRELNKIMTAYKYGIVATMRRTESVLETQRLYDEQTKIRSELKEYFGKKRSPKNKENEKC